MTLSLGTGTASVLLLIAKVTLLLLAALGVSALLQRASAGARHLLWVAVVGALLVLPGLAAWSPFRLEVLPAAASSVTAKFQEVSPRTTGSVSPPTLPNVANQTLPPASSPTTGETSAPTVSPWRVAATIWMAIALGVAAWLAFGFFAVRRIVRRARILEGRDWTGPLYEIADRLGIDVTPRVMRSEDVTMPFACGLVRPTIILPAEADGWDLERRRAVLMHELAHVRRRDLVGHTIGRLACAAYWFHPLVWTAVRRMRIESERACDDLALTCGLRPSVYAEHLLDIVSSVGKTRTPATAIPMAHRREFEGRMLAILDPDLSRRVGPRQAVALVAGLVALVVVVGGAVPAERSATPPDQPSALATAQTDSVEAQHITVRTDTAFRVMERSLRTTPPAPARESSAEINRDRIDSADLSRGAALMQQIVQDTGRDDRPTILIGVLRSDTSADLRRVAAWGLSRYAERADVGAALAVAVRRDGNSAVREMSAWALAHGSEREDAIDALAEAVRRDADAEVRQTAAWALGHLDAERAVDALGEAVSAQSEHLRMLALWAIGNAAPKSAPRAVMAALNDASKNVRHLASWALFRIKDPESVGPLEQALNREQDRELRMGYIRALGAIGERSSGALARLLDSRDPEVRAVVVEALAGKGGGPWPWPWPKPRPWP